MRGMVKWQPFSAVYDQNQAIDELLEKANQQEPPLLSSDQYEEMNQLLCEVNGKEQWLRCHYFKNGKIHEVKGILGQIDQVNQRIYLGRWIDVSSIVKLERT